MNVNVLIVTVQRFQTSPARLSLCRSHCGVGPLHPRKRPSLVSIDVTNRAGKPCSIVGLVRNPSSRRRHDWANTVDRSMAASLPRLTRLQTSCCIAKGIVLQCLLLISNSVCRGRKRSRFQIARATHAVCSGPLPSTKALHFATKDNSRCPKSAVSFDVIRTSCTLIFMA